MPDNLTTEQRKILMAKVKSKDTDLELAVRSALHRQGFRFRKHVKKLPGKPDVVFSKAKVAVFIDGDFWHGYNFEELKPKLSPFWQEKIGKNIERDQRNFAALEEMGWIVIRVWKHEIKRDLDSVVNKIVAVVKKIELPNSTASPR